jgi:hypothetical protein
MDEKYHEFFRIIRVASSYRYMRRNLGNCQRATWEKRFRLGRRRVSRSIDGTMAVPLRLHREERATLRFQAVIAI